MKYLRKDDVVYAFELDGSQDYLITEDMIVMTEDEVDQHINPTKYMTEEDKYLNYLSKLPKLTRRQFKLGLLEKGLLTDLESAIDTIEDVKQKAIIQIEYSESTTFKRTSDSVKQMLALINMQETEINEMWEKALAL